MCARRVTPRFDDIVIHAYSNGRVDVTDLNPNSAWQDSYIIRLQNDIVTDVSTDATSKRGTCNTKIQSHSISYQQVTLVYAAAPLLNAV